jgi:hypothetical protein
MVGGGGYAFAQDSRWRILAALEFIAHHGHLRIKILAFDIAVD